MTKLIDTRIMHTAVISLIALACDTGLTKFGVIPGGGGKIEMGVGFMNGKDVFGLLSQPNGDHVVII